MDLEVFTGGAGEWPLFFFLQQPGAGAIVLKALALVGLFTLPGFLLLNLLPAIRRGFPDLLERLLLGLVAGLGLVATGFIVLNPLVGLPITRAGVLGLAGGLALLGAAGHLAGGVSPCGWRPDWRQLVTGLILGLFFLLAFNARLINTTQARFQDQLLDSDPYRHLAKTRAIVRRGRLEGSEPLYEGNYPILEMQGAYVLAAAITVTGDFPAPAAGPDGRPGDHRDATWAVWKYSSPWMGALGLIGLYLLGRHLGGNRRALGLAAAVLGAGIPMYFIRSNIGFTDAWVYPYLALALLFFWRALDRTTYADGVLCGFFLLQMALHNWITPMVMAPYFLLALVAVLYFCPPPAGPERLLAVLAAGSLVFLGVFVVWEQLVYTGSVQGAFAAIAAQNRSMMIGDNLGPGNPFAVLHRNLNLVFLGLVLAGAFFVLVERHWMFGPTDYWVPGHWWPGRGRAVALIFLAGGALYFLAFFALVGILRWPRITPRYYRYMIPLIGPGAVLAALCLAGCWRLIDRLLDRPARWWGLARHAALSLAAAAAVFLAFWVNDLRRQGLARLKAFGDFAQLAPLLALLLVLLLLGLLAWLSRRGRPVFRLALAGTLVLAGLVYLHFSRYNGGWPRTYADEAFAACDRIRARRLTPDDFADWPAFCARLSGPGDPAPRLRARLMPEAGLEIAGGELPLYPEEIAGYLARAAAGEGDEWERERLLDALNQLLWQPDLLDPPLAAPIEPRAVARENQRRLAAAFPGLVRPPPEQEPLVVTNWFTADLVRGRGDRPVIVADPLRPLYAAFDQADRLQLPVIRSLEEVLALEPGRRLLVLETKWGPEYHLDEGVGPRLFRRLYVRGYDRERVALFERNAGFRDRLADGVPLARAGADLTIRGLLRLTDGDEGTGEQDAVYTDRAVPAPVAAWFGATFPVPRSLAGLDLVAGFQEPNRPGLAGPDGSLQYVPESLELELLLPGAGGGLEWRPVAGSRIDGNRRRRLSLSLDPPRLAHGIRVHVRSGYSDSGLSGAELEARRSRPPLLEEGDVIRWRWFCRRLADASGSGPLPPSPPLERLWSLLAPAAREAIAAAAAANEPDEAQRAAVLAAVNEVLERPDFYAADEFDAVPLKPEVRDRLAQWDELGPNERRELNRRLLEALLPGLIHSLDQYFRVSVRELTVRFAD